MVSVSCLKLYPSQLINKYIWSIMFLMSFCTTLDMHHWVTAVFQCFMSNVIHKYIYNIHIKYYGWFYPWNIEVSCFVNFVKSKLVSVSCIKLYANKYIFIFMVFIKYWYSIFVFLFILYNYKTLSNSSKPGYFMSKVINKQINKYIDKYLHLYNFQIYIFFFFCMTLTMKQ